jgi:predicted thioesterase
LFKKWDRRRNENILWKEPSMNFHIPLNIAAKKSLVVEPAVTADHIGSGSLSVLATPMMIALMESAALEVVQEHLPAGWTTVGTKVDVEHIRATPVGDIVSAEANLVEREGRSLTFSVQAKDSSGIIGQGLHRRFIVNCEKFLSKL